MVGEQGITIPIPKSSSALILAGIIDGGGSRPERQMTQSGSRVSTRVTDVIGYLPELSNCSSAASIRSAASFFCVEKGEHGFGLVTRILVISIRSWRKYIPHKKAGLFR
ncbi:hypothetical protein CEXT_432501 [Caerostris extrusa]|uniref:Uncharacterized protein n=1 Tax=Caerostris extrusa TaxID=172846 RepID=A0AAV4R0X4_CAEEX|nr:hypothetical protein CEXT_432501 [Caerostris extrusa]